ncbi:NACHT, LRR and PYD domains-containing protein 3-like [Patiria miniata]|uniref:NACHT domain-containing protein n=1 Tax=Patiria miniata TaxID=46514 RepID=A0A914B4I8_PATMI|nr:NACHT, LRR and PYD domains-containing protein 3-like [Patiria miniata]XP_038070720.1 NACHT, LRR and PYD domains-containing protein 3-like [Patiria miniata]
MGQVLGSDLRYCQQQLNQHYKATTSTIPAHPLDPSRRVDINEFFFELQLAQRGKQTTQEHVSLPREERIVDKPENISLSSWEDFFRIRKVGGIKAILSGGAGFGKSTLLLRVANASTKFSLTSCLRKFKLVFLVKLKQMRNSSCVIDAIFEQIFPINIRLTKPQLKELIADNEANTLFLLDGLDEIPLDVLNSQEGVYRVQDILHGRVLPKSFVLVTTRPHMVEYITKGYPHYAHVQTLGFTTETTNKYILTHFAENINSAEKLISNLKSNTSLQTMAQVPIITLLLCIVWENLSKLPERLTALYTEFAEVLVGRRCNEGEDKVRLMNSVLRGLGRVALDGLLDPKGERLVFSSDEFDKKDLEDGCRLGFLQQESCTSGLALMQIVTFIHKSVQEYCAAYFFANLHHADEEMFHEKLQQIHPGNVHAMEYLLRFTCGISSRSPATGLILEHVQKQHPVLYLKRFVRLLFFESNSHEIAARIDRSTHVKCDSQEDLIALRYFLHNVPLPLDDTEFEFGCRSYEVLTLLRDVLLDGNIKPATNQDSAGFIKVRYNMSARGNEELLELEETLERMDEALRDRLRLSLHIGPNSRLDDRCGRLPCISNQVEYVHLIGWPHGIVTLTNALEGCNILQTVILLGVNLRGRVCRIAPLVPPSLQDLMILCCYMNDDDVKVLISILPAGHGLIKLCVSLSSCTLKGVRNLTAHLRGLPNLQVLDIDTCSQIDRHLVKEVVKQDLPNVIFV